MTTNSFYKDVAKATVAVIVAMGLCRFTQGGMAIVIAVVGIVSALMHKVTIAMSCFIAFPLMVVFNRAIIGVSGVALLVARFAFVVMTVSAFMLDTGTRGREKLPIAWITLYIVIAIISSMSGWMPMISYLKIINFVIMLAGIYLLSMQMQSFENLNVMRVMFMAMAVIMVVGSLLVYFVPSVGYSMMLYRMEGFGLEVSAEELAAGESLFNGMTCHSQMLSPVVAGLATWVLCDMIMIDRRVTLLHGAILSCVPILLYMSRSRGGFLMLSCVMLLTFLVAIPRARLPMRVKRHLSFAMITISVVLIGAGIYFQVKNDAISRWLRKTDDVASDTRTLEEAFTGSRQALIEMNLRDFKLNPLLGKGFQVVDGMKQAYEAGQITWFSAAVEKGVTPYVILGETGILGAIAFIIFLWSFYSTCFRRGYMSLMTNFTCFLVANLADSTFFSPSGLGGFMWMVACIGAFSTDCLAKQLHWMRASGEWEQGNWNWPPARV